MTLREKLIALADKAAVDVLLRVGGDRGTFHDLALVAARRALEDAAKVCDNAAKGEHSISVNGYTRTMMDAPWICENCAATIRALRDGIA